MRFRRRNPYIAWIGYITRPFYITGMDGFCEEEPLFCHVTRWSQCPTSFLIVSLRQLISVFFITFQIRACPWIPLKLERWQLSHNGMQV